MQTIFDAGTRDELLRRLDTIQPGSQRQWGKMSAAQMLEHTVRVLEMATGRKLSKQALPGKLIAWMFCILTPFSGLAGVGRAPSWVSRVLATLERGHR